jgi:hypothetical protein
MAESIVTSDGFMQFDSINYNRPTNTADLNIRGSVSNVGTVTVTGNTDSIGLTEGVFIYSNGNPNGTSANASLSVTTDGTAVLRAVGAVSVNAGQYAEIGTPSRAIQISEADGIAVYVSGPG